MTETKQLDLQDFPVACLYVVSTPIGNLFDLTYRATHILSNVDGIACEDKRHTTSLLKAFNIQRPLLALHEHNEMEASQTIASHLAAGQRWAYVCDAGTPGISDPGARLVSTLIKGGYRVIPIPGVSAVTTLASIGGAANLQTDGRFQFLGFLPNKTKDRDLSLQKINAFSLNTIVYESPVRIQKTLGDLYAALEDKNRMVVIGRELTKKFETITYLKVHEIPSWILGKPELRGEFSILIEGRPLSESPEPNSAEDVPINPQLLASLLNPYLGSKDISEIFAKAGIMTKKNAYQLALNNKTLPS